MLCGYFDESGQHDPTTGHLTRLSLGGCMTGQETCQKFSAEWSAILCGSGIQMFHMADFEAYQGEFRGWTEEQHKQFLERLLSIMVRHIKLYIAISHAVTPQRKAFRKTYKRTVITAIAQALNFSEPGSLMFAEHEEFNLKNLDDYFDGTPFEGRVESCSTANPKRIVPLQAADLYVYEVKKLAENPNRIRYPWWRLQGHGASTFAFTL
jgi:hypothetical protein